MNQNKYGYRGHTFTIARYSRFLWSLKNIDGGVLMGGGGAYTKKGIIRKAHRYIDRRIKQEYWMRRT